MKTLLIFSTIFFLSFSTNAEYNKKISETECANIYDHALELIEKQTSNKDLDVVDDLNDKLVANSIIYHTYCKD